MPQGDIFDLSINSLSDDAIVFDEAGETIEDKQETQVEEPVKETAEPTAEATQETQEFIEFDSEGLSEDDQVQTEETEQKEEEKEDTTIQDKVGESQSTSDKTSPSPISSLASALYEDGILPNLDSEAMPTNGAELAEALNKEIESGVNDFIENLPDDLKSVLSNYKEGVPLNDLIENKSAQMRYNSITDERLSEDANLQKQIVFSDLKAKGFTDDRAKKYIEKFEDLGDLEEESKASLTSLKGYETNREEHIKRQAQEQKQAQETEAQKMLENIQTSVDKTEEIIPGIKLNKSMRGKVFQSMTKAVDTDAQGNPVNALMKKRAENPVEFEMKLHYLFNLTKGFEDWSAVSNKAKTSAMGDLEKTLSKGSDFKTAGNPLNDTPEIDSGLAQGLSSMFGDKK